MSPSELAVELEGEALFHGVIQRLRIHLSNVFVILSQALESSPGFTSSSQVLNKRDIVQHPLGDFRSRAWEWHASFLPTSH